MSSDRLIVGLGHKSRVGKDTVGDYLHNVAGFHQASFAANLYTIVEEIQRVLGRPMVKDPELLQRCGMMLREHYGEDVFVDRLFENLPASGRIVITDVRFKNEFARVQSENGLMIDISRADRLIDRDPNHISEVDLDGANWDYVVENNGSISELCDVVDGIIRDEIL